MYEWKQTIRPSHTFVINIFNHNSAWLNVLMWFFLHCTRQYANMAFRLKRVVFRWLNVYLSEQWSRGKKMREMKFEAVNLQE